MLDRLDFVKYGTAPAYLKVGGTWQDHVLYQLLSPVPDLEADRAETQSRRFAAPAS